ncbi:flagellar basal body rod protein FlgB [Heliorestis acidaminivorans]|uniref:Flagellar basal body rod protein FlgB n=1 Tax=Heliorestis acidaminivorans TaxID=553427 RepID=A0A6I0F330_9FIRM|nr:flagellar basal body rod protein FlgB [Heliorestis acidaminivorans]KAB2954401.1 flagellar basal body rod protein FlgB [Heliorestis acidaminivorans]
MAQFLDTASTSLLEKGLNVAALRHKVIADNIANVDTPGYKRKEVSFESELAQVMKGNSQMKMDGSINNSRHIPIMASSIHEVNSKTHHTKEQSYRNDENNVDIDKEMAVLAKNTLWYDAMITQISRRLSGLKNVIKEVR